MSIGRSGGSSGGAVITAVVLGFMTVIAMLMAVMFYADASKSKKQMAADMAEINAIVSPAERASDNVKKMVDEAAKEPGRSVLTHLNVQLGNIKRVVMGTDDKSVREIQEALVKSGVGEGVSAIRAIDTLKGEKVAMDKKVKALEAQIASATAAAEGQTAELTKAKAAYDEAIKKMAADLAKIQEDAKSGQTATDEAVKALTQRGEEMAAEYDKKMKEAEAKLASSQAKIVQLTGLVEEIRRLNNNRPDAPNAALEVDGRVIAVDPDRNLAYVNIGSSEHLVMGMTFEVFDPVRGPQADDTGKLRGVATVEVVDIAPNSAACRVVRGSPGRPVLVNDQIANLIYDRSRIFKFYIFGEFDLDNDGSYTIADRDAIEALIHTWGGQIVQPSERQRQLAAALGKDLAKDATLLPLDTDFLIVGKEPELPKPVPADASAEEQRRAVEAKARWDQYIKLVNEAKSFSVPVLNQNRFLTLIGYYRR